MLRLMSLPIPAAGSGSLRRPALTIVQPPARAGARRRGEGWQPVALGLAALLSVYGSWQLLGWGPATDRQLIGDAFFYPVGAAAVFTSWRTAQRCAGWARLRRAWLLLALAALAYLLGDVAQTVYELRGARPYPSIADGFYLLFYPLMLAGVLSFPAVRRRRGERVRLGLDLAVVALGGCALVIYVVLGPTALAGGDSVQAAFSVAYPVGDMVLLLGLGSVLLRGSAPSARRALQVLAFAIAAYVAADLVYGYITLHSSYQGGDPVDTLWMVAIAATALAPAVQRSVREPEQITPARDRVAAFPYAAVLLGFAVLLFSDRRDSLFPGLTMTMVALALAALVLVRQLLAQRDLVGAQSQLRHQALHDSLTGLPNRLLIPDRIEQAFARARRDGSNPAVLFLDLDGFKHVNDTLGHAAGDALLQAVGARLSSVVREADTLARLGGDEFMILLEDTKPHLVAERILAVLREPIDLNGSAGRSVAITASIGIATGTRTTTDELVRDADLALYRAKESGKDRFAVYEANMHEAAEERRTLQLDIHDALDANEFFLMYQPTFDLSTETVTGIEALLRWRHPTRGIVSPDVFIPIAEETGTIVPIGRWVLAEACRQAAAWRRRGHAIGIAVNVSPRQLDEPSFVPDVQSVLAASGLEATALSLEITETTLMREPALAARQLRELKRLGVRIAIDDFGTGYSSLAYLRQFPVDTLKIDRSFISGIASSKESTALIRTLIQLGKTLGLEMLGEGIEDHDQLRRLQREQCDLGQGYLLARPLDLPGIETFLAANTLSLEQPA
jgi:diguanylate cyclase (GGDEF)-like protein